jgi:hypothetical protein
MAKTPMPPMNGGKPNPFAKKSAKKPVKKGKC